MTTRIFYSNSIENLAQKLSKQLNRNTHDPLTPRTIIIPNPHVKKWLQMQISQINGISINLDFQPLEEGLWNTISILDIRSSQKNSLLDAKTLELLVLSVLMQIRPDEAVMAPVAAYLYNSDGTLKKNSAARLWQTAVRMSRHLIDYEYYRPDIIDEWKNGNLKYGSDIEKAQREIYSIIFSEKGLVHNLPNHLLTLPSCADTVFPAEKTINDNLFVFGISHFSPVHTRLFYQLGKSCDVFIYQINPCSEFWEDVTTAGEDKWIRKKNPALRTDDGSEFLTPEEEDNMLLKLWGKAGRETSRLLGELEDKGSMDFSFISEWLPEAEQPPETVLAHIQHSVKHRTNGIDKKNRIDQDTSLQIAACSDIFREVETLYNSILSNLEDNPSLKMTDIAVRTPDIELYAPVIKSVFSKEPSRIRYSIIDSNATGESHTGKALLDLLELASGTFTRKEVFSLIFNPCFLEAVSMTAEDAQTWLKWADRLNIFHSSTVSAPEKTQKNPHSWEHGLTRLRLGRIMSVPDRRGKEQGFRNYMGFVPYSDTNSSDSGLVAAFSLIMQELLSRTSALNNAVMSGKKWAETINSLINDFLDIPEEHQEEKQLIGELRSSLSRLQLLDEVSDQKKQKPSLTLQIVREFINDNLSKISGSRGSYLSTGINISALIPNRPLPFEIIYLLGMGEGKFPGTDDTSALDLKNKTRKIGDITGPDANRYQFLENILSAGKKLYISYISRDLKHDRNYEPNSTAAQLISFVKKKIIHSEFRIIEVPMHGTNPRYIKYCRDELRISDLIFRDKGGKPVSSNHCLREKLSALADMGKKSEAVFTETLGKKLSQKIKSATPDFSMVKADPSAMEYKTEKISIKQLENFLINPLESALNLHLELFDQDRSDPSESDDEPFYSVFPFDYRIVTDIMDMYTTAKGQLDPVSYFDDYYRNSLLTGDTPSGKFADIDLIQLKKEISARIFGENGISDIITSGLDLEFHNNVTVGQGRGFSDPGKRFPSVLTQYRENNSTQPVEINASLPYVWRDKKTDACQTLVLTTSSNFRIEKTIYPFLFYTLARSGYDQHLQEFIGEGPFTIHVASAAGIKSIKTHMPADSAAEYADSLVRALMRRDSFEMLPFSLIVDPKDKKLYPMLKGSNEPTESMRNEFAEKLTEKITTDQDRMFSSYRGMEIMSIIEQNVSHDALDCSRKRFAPFIEMIENDET